MSCFVIEGGHRLSGEIFPQGAKNEVLQILCAVLLTREKVTVSNIPDILDVNNLIALLQDMGVKVEKLGEGRYSFCAEAVDMDYLRTPEFLKRNASLRGSIMLTGPMLARFGYALTAKPGGDKIGRRRLDTHFEGLKKLGAEFSYNKDNATFELRADRLRGTRMLLDYNAACEPYLQQLCRMLVRMGARISGIASNLLTIEGVSELHGTEHTVLPDMIEVGSFIGMAAMTQSEITIKNVSYDNLGIIPESFRRLGIALEQRGDDIYVPAQDEYAIETFLDQCRGCVLIHQKMFESRLFFVDKLIDMGAQIILCDPHRAVVVGHNRMMNLRGREMTSPDIRAGIAMLIAAMGAVGTSRIHNIEQIDRGYQNIEGRLNALGARITRID